MKRISKIRNMLREVFPNNLIDQKQDQYENIRYIIVGIEELLENIGVFIRLLFFGDLLYMVQGPNLSYVLVFQVEQEESQEQDPLFGHSLDEVAESLSNICKENRFSVHQVSYSEVCQDDNEYLILVSPLRTMFYNIKSREYIFVATVLYHYMSDLKISLYEMKKISARFFEFYNSDALKKVSSTKKGFKDPSIIYINKENPYILVEAKELKAKFCGVFSLDPEGEGVLLLKDFKQDFSRFSLGEMLRVQALILDFHSPNLLRGFSYEEDNEGWVIRWYLDKSLRYFILRGEAFHIMSVESIETRTQPLVARPGGRLPSMEETEKYIGKKRR